MDATVARWEQPQEGPTEHELPSTPLTEIPSPESHYDSAASLDADQFDRDGGASIDHAILNVEDDSW
jgi:hypothetical protein